VDELLEIEIKCYCDDHDRVKSLLAAAGAQFVETRTERDLYFNHPSRNFAETDEALRLREVNSKCRITYKGPKLSKTTKARIEHETDTGDYNTMKSILLSLGFVESGIIEKERYMYSYQEWRYQSITLTAWEHSWRLKKQAGWRTTLKRNCLI